MILYTYLRMYLYVCICVYIYTCLHIYIYTCRHVYCRYIVYTCICMLRMCVRYLHMMHQCISIYIYHCISSHIKYSITHYRNLDHLTHPFVIATWRKQLNAEDMSRFWVLGAT